MKYRKFDYILEEHVGSDKWFNNLVVNAPTEAAVFYSFIPSYSWRFDLRSVFTSWRTSVLVVQIPVLVFLRVVWLHALIRPHRWGVQLLLGVIDSLQRYNLLNKHQTFPLYRNSLKINKLGRLRVCFVPACCCGCFRPQGGALCPP